MRFVRRIPDTNEFIITQDGLSTRYSFKAAETKCEGIETPCYEVQSETGKAYTCWADEWGAKCDCPDFTFRREDAKVPCKHLLVLAKLGIIKLPRYLDE